MMHATTVALGDLAVLIRGVSGSGKSDLALRLIDSGAQLVADDQTCLRKDEGRLWASPPAAIAGLLEVRGLGLVRLPYRRDVAVAVVVDLVDAAGIERLPEAETADVCGVPLRLLRLSAFEASAAAKVRLAVLAQSKDIMFPL